jgi:nitrate reductase NapD
MPMPDRVTFVISSAVVSVKPGQRDAVVDAVGRLADTDVRAAAGNKIVVVLEGRSRDEVGARLARIADFEGVISATLVFEHVDGNGEGPS